MSKLLRGQDRLLLALSLIGDMLDLTIGAGNRAYRYRKLGFYFPPGYKSFNLNNNVHRSLKTGNLKKVSKNNQIYLQLTGQGSKKLKRNFPLLKLQQKKWDMKWRIVIFDIPEKFKLKRNILRNKLKSLGFSQFQRSNYITPHNFSQDILEFLQHHQLYGQAFIVEVSNKFLPDEKELSNKLWKTNQLNQEYKSLLDQLNLSKTLTVKQFQKITQKYLNILIRDPHLPYQLLPSNWYEVPLRKKITQTTISKDGTIVA